MLSLLLLLAVAVVVAAVVVADVSMLLLLLLLLVMCKTISKMFFLGCLLAGAFLGPCGGAKRSIVNSVL